MPCHYCTEASNQLHVLYNGLGAMLHIMNPDIKHKHCPPLRTALDNRTRSLQEMIKEIMASQHKCLTPGESLYNEQGYRDPGSPVSGDSGLSMVAEPSQRLSDRERQREIFLGLLPEDGVPMVRLPTPTPPEVTETIVESGSASFLTGLKRLWRRKRR